jgi:hypothetical protein
MYLKCNSDFYCFFSESHGSAAAAFQNSRRYANLCHTMSHPWLQLGRGNGARIRQLYHALVTLGEHRERFLSEHQSHEIDSVKIVMGNLRNEY